ncbi:HNH endonuclease [Streptomyces venezuelae]
MRAGRALAETYRAYLLLAAAFACVWLRCPARKRPDLNETADWLGVRRRLGALSLGCFAVCGRRYAGACCSGWGVLGGPLGSAPWSVSVVMPGCAQCGSLVLTDVVDMDHVQPLALGGEDTDGNVQPVCRECHLTKTGEDFSG